MSDRPQTLTAIPATPSVTREDGHFASPPPFLCIHGSLTAGAAWVHASGELDLAAAPELERVLSDAQESAQLVVLDLHDLSFIDTSGVHAIVEASRRAVLDGRRLTIAFAPAHVVDIFAATETWDAVEMFELEPADRPVGPLLHLVSLGRYES